MTDIFESVLQMSLTGSVLALAVMVLRLALRKAPKRLLCLLWALVALRLVCPFSIESSLSLVPKPIADGQIISEITDYSEPEEYFRSIPDDYVQTIAPDPESVFHVYPIQERPTPMATFSKIWAAGAALMLLYAIVSYQFLRRRMAEATRLHDNVWQSERTDSPFVLGLFRPRIYLPYRIDPADLPHVIAHERTHIHRGDHWWKPLGFVILSVHWFNPVLWASYILLCRDIESACDEAVIASMEKPERQAYSTALLHCSIRRNYIAACPVAFGEVGVKERVKRVMKYKKPTFRFIIIVLMVCALVAVCFLTDPNPSRKFPMKGANVSDLEPEGIVDRILDIEDWKSSNVYMNSNNFTLTVDSEFNWSDPLAIRYFFTSVDETYSSQLRIFPEDGEYFLTEPEEWPEQNRVYLLRHFLEALKYFPQDAIQEMAPADRYIIEHREEGTPKNYDRVITYSSDGVQELDGWLIHLRIQPLHEEGEGYRGTGEEVIELFYGASDELSVSHNPVLHGTILEIRDGYFLVEPIPGSAELSIASKIEVPMENMSLSREPQVGDILRIEYDGKLAETYPVRITIVFRIEVVTGRFTYGQDATGAYRPIGVSGENVTELSRLSDAITWQDSIGFSELAPGEEIVSEDAIMIKEENSSMILAITWGRASLVLEYGIRSEDGNEYFQEKQGGSSILRITDIPAGNYHLYVRNSETYSGIPSYEKPEEFPNVSFEATGALLCSAETD